MLSFKICLRTCGDPLQTRTSMVAAYLATWGRCTMIALVLRRKRYCGRLAFAINVVPTNPFLYLISSLRKGKTDLIRERHVVLLKCV